MVLRSGYTGERGYELVPAWDAAGALWDAVLDHGPRARRLPCGLGARDTLRTEMGYPLHGNDLGPAITPVMAGASWAVGWDKERFWGRDALLAERAAKTTRLCRGLLVTGRGIPRAHCAVRTPEGTTVGEVTSGTFSPTRKQGIALALLDRSRVRGRRGRHRRAWPGCPGHGDQATVRRGGSARDLRGASRRGMDLDV